MENQNTPALGLSPALEDTLVTILGTEITTAFDNHTDGLPDHVKVKLARDLSEFFAVIAKAA